MWCQFAEGVGGGFIGKDSILFKSTHKSRTKTTSLIFIAISLTVVQKRIAKQQKQ